LAPLDARDIGQRVAWLASVLDSAGKVARSSVGDFGIFGTAIAASWLFGPLADRVTFFVDEDAARIGQRHEGRPILAPDLIPSRATVFVPLVPEVASAVAARLGGLGVDTHVPPPQWFEAVAA
jgi:hypothetical protein